MGYLLGNPAKHRNFQGFKDYSGPMREIGHAHTPTHLTEGPTPITKRCPIHTTVLHHIYVHEIRTCASHEDLLFSLKTYIFGLWTRFLSCFHSGETLYYVCLLHFTYKPAGKEKLIDVFPYRTSNACAPLAWPGRLLLHSAR